MKSVLVQCEQLSVTLGGMKVLEGVTLQVLEGDFLGIIGPNGGGKTTFLRTILGLQSPSSGSVRVFGLPPGRSPGRIGYVPQRLFFDREFPISVRDLVMMGRLSKKKLFQHYNPLDRQKSDEAMQLAGLERLSEHRIGSLSGGELQRALIARALAGEPELLLLDEPTASIDPQMKSSIYDLLERLKKKLTIILVSHDTSTISRYVESIVELNVTLERHDLSSVYRPEGALFPNSL